MSLQALAGIALAAAAVLPLAVLGPGASAQAAGPALDAQALGKLEQRIRSGELDNVHEVVVLQGGKTAAEWYFQGPDQRRGENLGVVKFGPDTLHDLRSATKSVVSILFGLALADGAIKSLDEPVLDYFPEYTDLRTPERMKIRLRDLLSMTSGLRWDERTYPYTDARNSEIQMDRAADRYRYILSQPIDAAPGERFTYSGGDVALIAAVIARATGERIDVYAKRKLFHPLGIDRFEWLKDAKGVPIAASGLRLSARDMAKLGQMMLQQGRWEGRQIAPAAWVDESTSQHAKFAPDQRCGIQYGYYWWLGALCRGDERTPFVFAVGNGGQYIWIVRPLDLVIVSTTGLYDSPTDRGDQSSSDIALSVIAATQPAAAKAASAR